MECGAWVIDWKYDFHYRWHHALESAEVYTQPIGEVSVRWPDRQIRLRTPDMYGPRKTPHQLGGQVIPNAWPDGKQRFFAAEDLAKDSRKQVFILGGSAAFGYPYAYKHNLAVQLTERTNATEWRFLNAGQPSWTSGQVLGVAKRVLTDFRPHTLILYSGNNEWFHWKPGSNRTTGAFSSLRFATQSKAASGVLYGWKRLKQRHFERLASQGSPRPLIGIHYALDHPASHQDWRAEQEPYLDQYRENIHTLLRLASERDVRVIVMTVPFKNRLAPAWTTDQPVSLLAKHRQPVLGHLETAAEALAIGDPIAAHLALDQIEALGEYPPLLHAIRASIYEQSQQFDAAEREYRLTRNAMRGHLGHRTDINDILRSLAAQHQAPLVEAHTILVNADPPFGDAMIHDDCHPTPSAIGVLADALAPLHPAN